MKPDKLLENGIVLGGYHIEAGSKKYKEYTEAMIAEIGEDIKPYLRLIYESVRYYPNFDSSGMDDAETIERIVSNKTAKHD